MKYPLGVLRVACVIGLLLLGCGAAPSAKTPSPSARPTAEGSAARPAKQSAAAAAPLQFIEDDVDAAMATARREHKALLVDAWAPWCHTCLSMKAFVFADPALRPLADRVVFVSIDTDR